MLANFLQVCEYVGMLNQSNKNVPTRRVEFLNVTLRIVQSSVEDPTKTRVFNTKVSAHLDQDLDDGFWALSQARYLEGNAWNTEEVSVEHSFVDFTEQFVR